MLKKTVPLFIAGIGGLIVMVAFFSPRLEEVGNEVSTWFNILAAFAFILGGGNLLKLNLKKISSREPGWGYAAVLLASFLGTLAIGLCKFNVPPASEFPAAAWSGKYDQEGGGYWFIYNYSYSPLAGTMFALLAFFVASAAFRAFRAKNVAATLLLGSALIVLLGRTFAGVILTRWLEPYAPGATIPGISTFILQVFNTAGQRAIMIGIALGIVATSLKILMGIDRSYIGSDSK
jgi:hypothetical protein